METNRPDQRGNTDIFRYKYHAWDKVIKSVFVWDILDECRFQVNAG